MQMIQMEQMAVLKALMSGAELPGTLGELDRDGLVSITLTPRGREVHDALAAAYALTRPIEERLQGAA